MKSDMWKRVTAIGVVIGMLMTSMPAMAFDDEMIIADDSYIVADDETEAMIAPESDDIDESDFDESFISEEVEPENGDEFTPGITYEETEEELQAAASTETSGTCGDNLTWVLESDETLYIYGTGAMYDYIGVGTPFYGRTDIKAVIIENGVTSIGWEIFSNCSELYSVEIPDSVTSIGKYAFSDCSSLTSIEIPSGVTNIGEHAFQNCSSLTSIEIPSSVTSIGVGAFSNCSSLTSIEIPSRVTSIDRVVFSDCSSLTSIEIPSSVTSIGNGAFQCCSSLTSIEIPSSVTSIGYGAFYRCSNLMSIEIPSGVTSIGEYAFESCSSLTSIEIPSSVTSIGEYAFCNCFSLMSIEIPSRVTSIGKYAFSDCSSLTSIEIPSGVTSIGEHAFQNCSSLTSIEIPSSVTSIGVGVFSYCSSLTSIEIPSSVTSIGKEAFSYCSSLTSIEIPSSVTSIGVGAFSDCSNLMSIEIPSSVTSIDRVVFSDCSSLTSIEIPSSVTSIGEGAFQYCSNLMSIEIPSGVTSIGEYAFQYCSSLTSIEIPSSVTSIGERAFNGCTSLIIYGYTGSYAETYALENGIPFVALDAFHHTLDYYVNTSSSEYNPELACDLMKLAWDAYGPNTVQNEHNVGTDEKIKADYEKLGFDVSTSFFSKNYDKWAYFQDYCGFSFAVKDRADGGRIVAITIRGTVGEITEFAPEWISNLLNAVPPLYETGWHMGFFKPAYDIFYSLEDNDLIDTHNTTYFITGHSRGAGVGNALAVLLSQIGISKENLYDYNFACPDTMYAPIGTSWSGGGKYNNIFNINAANDLVGVIPGLIGDVVGMIAPSIIKEMKGVDTVYIWGKYGNTYCYSFDWNSIERSVVNPITFFKEQGSTNPHQPLLYYEYLSKKNSISSFRSFAGNGKQNVKSIFGFCPVNMTIVDGNGADIVTVKNGDIIYYNNYGMGDALVMTDGDFKAFFVDPSIDCKVKIQATDSGEMAFISGIIDLSTREFECEKHFYNVKLKPGKTFFSEGLSETDAGKVKLYTTDSKGNKVAEVNSDGKETKIVKRVTPKKASDKITVTKKPSIKKPVAAKGKITVKWKHFKHTSKKTKKIWKKIKKVQIQCATDKAFKNIVKNATVKKSKTSAKIKGLKKKMTYYVRVRYFDGTGYSAWSKVKKVKTK